MSIIRPRVWTRQPQAPVRLNTNCPLSNGIMSAYSEFGMTFVDVVRNAHSVGVTSPANYKNSYGNCGKALAGDGSLSASAKGVYTQAGAIPYHGLAEFSAAFVVEINSDFAYETAIFRATSYDTTSGVALDLLNRTTIRALVATNGVTGWSASYDFSDPNIKLNVPWVFGFSYKSGRRIVMSAGVGGRCAFQVNTSITGTISDTGGASGITYIGGMLYGNNTTVAFPGKIYSGFFSKRALTLEELAEYAKNPWQIFAPRVT